MHFASENVYPYFPGLVWCHVNLPKFPCCLQDPAHSIHAVVWGSLGSGPLLAPTLGFHSAPHCGQCPTLHTLCLPEPLPLLIPSPVLCLSPLHPQNPPPPRSLPCHVLLRPQFRSQELKNFITKEDELLEDQLCPLGVCLAHKLEETMYLLPALECFSV